MAQSTLIDDLMAALRFRETGIKSSSLNPTAKKYFHAYRHDWAQESRFDINLIALGRLGHGQGKSASSFSTLTYWLAM